MLNIRQHTTHNTLTMWKHWASQDQLTRDYPKTEQYQIELNRAQKDMENSYIERSDRSNMPMLDPNQLRSRFHGVGSSSNQMLPIKREGKWPFNSSAGTGAQLCALLWYQLRQVPADQVWHLDDNKKKMLINSLAKVLLDAIDNEIEDVLQLQLKAAHEYDEMLTKKWADSFRSKRIIGMTADFAAANRKWVSEMCPHGIIVDEASEILESTLVSIILATRAEHLILLGTSDNLVKPCITNPALAGTLDVSLFERLKESKGGIEL